MTSQISSNLRDCSRHLFYHVFVLLQLLEEPISRFFNVTWLLDLNSDVTDLMSQMDVVEELLDTYNDLTFDFDNLDESFFDSIQPLLSIDGVEDVADRWRHNQS